MIRFINFFILLGIISNLFATDNSERDNCKETRTFGYYSLLQNIGDDIRDNKIIEIKSIDDIVTWYKEESYSIDKIMRWIKIEDIKYFVDVSSVDSNITQKFVDDINERVKFYNLSQKNIDQMLSDWRFTGYFWLYNG